MTRSLRHRLRRRHVSPYVWGCLPIISPYADRLQRAAFPGKCFYLVLTNTETNPSGGDSRG